jgi:hypothetical protein
MSWITGCPNRRIIKAIDRHHAPKEIALARSFLYLFFIFQTFGAFFFGPIRQPKGLRPLPIYRKISA